jgi:putative membrane protein
MIESLPVLNAFLNSASAVLLFLGHRKMTAKQYDAHKRLMIAAFTVSCIFLCSYLTYHAVHGTTTFLGQGISRIVYFTILGSHTILAAAVVPLAIISLSRGLKNRTEAHRKIARFTYPVWLYVSVTGVVIYLMLYQLSPHS